MFKFLKQFRAAYRIRRSTRRLVHGKAVAKAIIDEFGIAFAHEVWLAARAPAKPYPNQDMFDAGFELMLAEAYAMEVGGEATITLQGGNQPGMIVGRCDSYGNWKYGENL